MSTACPHPDFAAHVNVVRLEDSGRFAADVRIHCTACGVPMRFIGLPAGVDLEGAATSPDATEARLAIAPKGEVVPAVEGPVGFSVRRTGGPTGGVDLRELQRLVTEFPGLFPDVAAAARTYLALNKGFAAKEPGDASGTASLLSAACGLATIVLTMAVAQDRD